MPQNAKTALNIRTVKFTLLLMWIKGNGRRDGEGIDELDYAEGDGYVY